jgi:hypothetical protein
LGAKHRAPAIETIVPVTFYELVNLCQNKQVRAKRSYFLLGKVCQKSPNFPETIKPGINPMMIPMPKEEMGR